MKAHYKKDPLLPSSNWNKVLASKTCYSNYNRDCDSLNE